MSDFVDIDFMVNGFLLNMSGSLINTSSNKKTYIPKFGTSISKTEGDTVKVTLSDHRNFEISCIPEYQLTYADAGIFPIRKINNADVLTNDSLFSLLLTFIDS